MQLSNQRSAAGLRQSLQEQKQRHTLRCVPTTNGLRPSHAPTCRVTNELITIAGVSPTLMQDVLVGGAVVGTVAFALVAGLKQEKVVCDLCQGNGGSRCFGCDGEGKMTKLISRDALMEASARRDVLGRSANARNCRVCKGAGLLPCSKCRGSGYVDS